MGATPSPLIRVLARGSLVREAARSAAGPSRHPARARAHPMHPTPFQPPPFPFPLAFPRRLQLHTSARTHAAPIRSRAPPPPVNPLSRRDGHIPYRTVQLVSSTDNSLSPPTPLSGILDSYNHATHTLTLVSLEPPIVKLLNKEEVRQKARVAEVKAKLNRKTAVEEKEVQVSWASAIGDLRHKLNMARSILEKGDRATVIYAPKAGSDKIPPDQQVDITEMFVAELEEVGVRWKEDEKSKGTWIQFWGPVAKVREERKAKVQEAEVEKRKEKDEKKEARRKKEEERRHKEEERRLQVAKQLAELQDKDV